MTHKTFRVCCYIGFMINMVILVFLLLNSCVSVPSGVDKDTHKKILSAIERVHWDEVYEVDWTGDGQFNCMDRAWAFYKYYNGQCKIVRNVKLNHAYIQVWTGNNWLAIDPGAYGYSSYTMRYVWGNYGYDGKDIDRTDVYIALYSKRGTYK